MNRENNNAALSSPNFFIINAVELAKKLLGKILVRNINGQVIKVKIEKPPSISGG